MKITHIFFLSLLFLIGRSGFSQNAPLTTAGKVLDASAGTINVPVTVSNFDNIGSITLTLDYNPSVISYVSATPSPAFSGMTIDGSVPGQLVISWTTVAGAITLPDESQLAEVEFSYISGSTSLSWDNAGNGGSNCEYADDVLVPLNDTPTADYYVDGFVTSHVAPTTMAPEIGDVVAGPIDVPITVENFWGIGAIALTLEYDPNILTFTGSTPHSNFGAAMIVGNSPSAGGKYKIVISWISAPPDFIPETLADGTTLVDLHFNYAPVPFSGNHSLLNWVTDGTACEYGDSAYTTLYDKPYEDYYFDGIVAEQLAPGTYLPGITTAQAGPINVPVTVVDFQNIGAVALTFEYDATVINFVGHTPNAAFANNLFLSNQVNGTTGKVVISYFGTAVSLADMDAITDIEFTYVSGTTTLVWLADGTACDYGDAQFYSLYDEPSGDYYFDGLVAGQVSPQIKADSMSVVSGTQITVPLRVWDFTDISSLSLTLDYDPGVLTYLGASPHPDIAVNFTEGATNPGRILIGWFNANPVDLANGTVLIYLSFSYSGGTSSLSWFDDGGSCEFTAGPLFTVLYDQPPKDYYIDGLVKPAGFTWTGLTSTDWMTASNWSDNVVPNSLSAVSIPSTPVPSFWPVYTGDFTLGDQCKSVDFDAGSIMTVTGDMTINPGKAFVNAGSGLLKVGGDWLNSGVFEIGTGEVEFIGPVDGYVPAGVLPADEVQNYSLTTSAALMTPISGGSAGPTGDHAHSDVNIGFSFEYAGTNYTQLRISTSGWVSMDLSGDDLTSGENDRLFFAADPANALAPWWDKLLADGSSGISYLTSGTAPNRVFTVEWNNVLTYNSVSTSRISFQLKLHETTNAIEFCYGTAAAGTHNTNEGASIGIKGTTGGAGDFIEATTATRNTMVTNLVSDTDWPTVNYTFTPPPDTLTFYKLKVGDNANLFIETDVKVVGIGP
ncbi:MAG: cohesin domain-containing protein [Bacteroidales bacterium]|nr:cohesin domain-containing protein [Bacteroidales bacterium]